VSDATARGPGGIGSRLPVCLPRDAGTASFARAVAVDTLWRLIDAVLRHLGGDWGDVDDACGKANDVAVATEGCLRSVYRLPGTGDALVLTTDADRLHTTATKASQHQTPP
jgi:hypothetical protein